MAGKKGTTKVWIRQGDHLLVPAAGLLGALGDAAEFPQDEAGIKALIVATRVGPDGEGVMAKYEEPDAPISYLDGHTRVAPAGSGRLRLREVAFGKGGEVTEVWILGPDGSLEGPELIEGYGMPEDEEPDEVLAERRRIEERHQEMLARQPEFERREEERRTRFRVEHLTGVIAGPADQDPSGPMVTHVVLYDAGVIVNLLLPAPARRKIDPDDPWPEHEEREDPSIELDDGVGTKFMPEGGGGGHGGDGPRRMRQEFRPAPSAGASRLAITIDDTRVELDLERLR